MRRPSAKTVGSLSAAALLGGALFAVACSGGDPADPDPGTGGTPGQGGSVGASGSGGSGGTSGSTAQGGAPVAGGGSGGDNVGGDTNQAGNGGGGTGGGSSACTPVVVAGDLITDFETNWDAMADAGKGQFKNEGYFGGTFTYPTSGSDPIPMSVVDGGAWTISGEIGTYSGFGIWFDCELDATQFAGVEFDVSGDAGPSGELKFLVQTSANVYDETKDHDYCMPADPAEPWSDCVNPSVTHTVGATPMKVSVTWDQLMSGKPQAGVNAAEILGLQWEVTWPPPAAPSGTGGAGGSEGAAPPVDVGGAGGGDAGGGGTDAGGGGSGGAASMNYMINVVIDNIRFIPTGMPGGGGGSGGTGGDAGGDANVGGGGAGGNAGENGGGATNDGGGEGGGMAGGAGGPGNAGNAGTAGGGTNGAG